MKTCALSPSTATCGIDRTRPVSDQSARSDSSPRLGLALALALCVVLAGCGGSTDEPLAAEPAPSSPGAAEIGFDTVFPAGVFSAPAAPLELSVTAASASAVSQEIGPEGGQLIATAPDGTTYTLEVPLGALPVPVTLTATPLTDVAGLPFDVQPQHRIGVALTPSGMTFAKPISLTIKPAATLPDAGVATLGYRGAGHDAGVELAIQSGGTLQLSIEHFSGYVATWPIREADWRTLARQTLEAKEAALRHVMATWLGLRAQMIMEGADPSKFLTEVEFARSMLEKYVAEVLAPRIQAAANGCRESQDAIGYWIAYWRQVAFLNVADDPDFFVTINGRTYTGMFEMPESLLPTAVENCLREDYQRCVASGDFFVLYRRMLTFYRVTQLIGQEFEPAWITLVSGYLQRCGRWELEVATRSRSEVGESGLVITANLRRTVKLAWKQGDGQGMDTLFLAKITGTAEPTLEQVNSTSGDCTLSFGPPSLETPAEASLRKLEWEYPDDPGTPDWAASGYPTALEIALHPGTLRTTIAVQCPEGSPKQLPWEFDGDLLTSLMLMAKHAVRDDDHPDLGAQKVLFGTGWEFAGLNPFRARLAREAAFVGGPIALTARIEMDLRHAPE